MKSKTCLRSVSCSESGEGLPYAPVNWPNPGDIWSWKVGRRISTFGFHRDRFLIGPISLQKDSCKRPYFQSKKSIEDYLRSEFPDTSVDAFFSSFVWKIPANISSMMKEQFATRPQKVIQQSTRRKSQRLTAWTGTCESTTDYLKSPTDSQNTQVTSSQNTNSPAQSFCVDSACLSPKEFRAKVIPEDFDKLLNSVDDFLSQPLPIASVLPLATDHSETLQEEMAKARKMLSLFLAVENPVMLSSTKLSELSFLSSKLKKDPSLSSEQHSMLKLIDEIPFASREFREAKKVADEANKFFADLKSNADLATTLKNDYNESKGKEALLEAEVNSISLEIEKIDEQIAKLQTQLAALSIASEKKKKEMAKLSSTQKKVVECLPKVVYEVQLANSKSLEWELKKKNSAILMDNILCKFAPLQGFSL